MLPTIRYFAPTCEASTIVKCPLTMQVRRGTDHLPQVPPVRTTSTDTRGGRRPFNPHTRTKTYPVRHIGSDFYTPPLHCRVHLHRSQHKLPEEWTKDGCTPRHNNRGELLTAHGVGGGSASRARGTHARKTANKNKRVFCIGVSWCLVHCSAGSALRSDQRSSFLRIVSSTARKQQSAYQHAWKERRAHGKAANLFRASRD